MAIAIWLVMAIAYSKLGWLNHAAFWGILLQGCN